MQDLPMFIRFSHCEWTVYEAAFTDSMLPNFQKVLRVKDRMGFKVISKICITALWAFRRFKNAESVLLPNETKHLDSRF